MRILYHLPLDPGSRKVRLILAEKGVTAELKTEAVWERREGFLRLNPAGEVPVLVEDDGTVLSDASVISEYIEELYPDPPLLGETPIDRAEARRLMRWFETKFAREVSSLLLEEKMMKRLLKQGTPDSATVRIAAQNIHYHLDYIGWLCERRRWLAGDDVSQADLTAAAHLSCIDYLGDVPWDEHLEARDWYARIKSRPCMRGILADVLPGYAPPKHYSDPDF